METPIRFRGLDCVELLGVEVPVATTPLSRLLGLALLPWRRAGAGLLIPDCRSVHTFGMRFRLDLVFLDDEARLIALRRAVAPGRVLRCPAAVAVLEVPSPQREARPPNPSRCGTDRQLLRQLPPTRP